MCEAAPDWNTRVHEHRRVPAVRLLQAGEERPSTHPHHPPPAPLLLQVALPLRHCSLAGLQVLLREHVELAVQPARLVPGDTKPRSNAGRRLRRVCGGASYRSSLALLCRESSSSIFWFMSVISSSRFWRVTSTC